MNKRRLFSRKDGTTFTEDVKDIAQDVEAFLKGLPEKIRVLLPEAEDFVIAVETISEAVKEGTSIDAAIDKALDIIPGTADERFYAWAQKALYELADALRSAYEDVKNKIEYAYQNSPELEYGMYKRNAAASLIIVYNDEKPGIKEANLAIETALYYIEKA